MRSTNTTRSSFWDRAWDLPSTSGTCTSFAATTRVARYHEPVDRRSWILLTFLALFVSLAFQGTRGLYDPSEGRYAEVAREMRASGNYLEPVLAHHPHLSLIHISEPTRLLSISYAVFCLKKKNNLTTPA